MHALTGCARPRDATHTRSIPPGGAMSVLIETSKGDIVIDLFTDLCPNTCRK